MDKVIKKKRWPVKRFLGILLLAGLGTFFYYQIRYVDNTPTVYASIKDTRLATVKKGEFQEFINITGTLIPGDTLYLDALEGGRVKELKVKEGDLVHKGQTLLVLENTNLEMDGLLKKASIIQAEFELESTRVANARKRHMLQEQLLDVEYKLDELARDYRRKKVLFRSKTISSEAFEKCEHDYTYWGEKKKMLQAAMEIEERLMKKNIQQLQAGIDLLRTDFRKNQKQLQDLIMVSPASGLLTSLDASVGENKTIGARLAQIDITETVKVEAEIDEYYLDRVRIGNVGTFEVVNPESYQEVTCEIRLVKISPEITDNVFLAEFVFGDNRPDSLRLGQSFTVRLALGQPHEAVIVEKGPFVQNTGGSWVYVVDKTETKAHKRRIRVGRNNPLYIEVLEGLVPDEKVIISAYDSYQNSDEIDLN